MLLASQLPPVFPYWWVCCANRAGSRANSAAAERFGVGIELVKGKTSRAKNLFSPLMEAKKRDINYLLDTGVAALQGF